VDLTGYAGDTLTVKVVVPPEVQGEWNAEVRATAGAAAVDATFAVTPPPSGGGDLFISLSSAQTAALLSGAPTARRANVAGGLATITQYNGVWDLQCKNSLAPDPVRTVVRGKLTIDQDVTRP
jgi:hypothetical protein